MDWFERLMGFREHGYEDTKKNLEVIGDRLWSLQNQKSYGIGQFERVSLGELRRRHVTPAKELMRVTNIRGDVRRMHHSTELNGALFQVASQFNMLEMTGPKVTPEHGVAIYAGDPTQGPACAIAAGAATIYRNYLVPLDGDFGQTASRQLDGLAAVGKLLAQELNVRVEDLWDMRNGYALCKQTGLRAVNDRLADDQRLREQLKNVLAIGLAWNAQVTDADSDTQFVSQAFCSALPVAYGARPSETWKPLGTLILEATYEATLLAAAENARAGRSKKVLLTRVGGGAFGNGDDWIQEAMRGALIKAKDWGLDVRLVSYSNPAYSTLELLEEFGERR